MRGYAWVEGKARLTLSLSLSFHQKSLSLPPGWPPRDSGPRFGFDPWVFIVGGGRGARGAGVMDYASTGQPFDGFIFSF